MIIYRYGMRLRGFSPFCQPMQGLREVKEGFGRYWNVLEYRRKLTAAEMRDYELDELGEEDEEETD